MEQGWNFGELAPGKLENDDDRAISPGLADEWMHHPISISNVQNEAFEVVDILIFEVVGLVDIWYCIIYFVRIGPEM